MTQALSNDNTIQLTAAQTSREVKKHLKKTFPSMEKLSVTCKNFSLRIRWINGPSRNAVEKAVKVFEGAQMVQNGGDMIKGYKDAVEFEGRKIDFGIDFIFCERELSPENTKIIVKYVSDAYGYEMPTIDENGRIMTPITWQFQKHISDLENETDGQDFVGLVWAPVETSIDTIAIKAPATVEATSKDVTTVEIVDPIQCVYCGFHAHPEHTQTINHKIICNNCIEEETATLAPEDVELPFEIEVTQIISQIEEITNTPLVKQQVPTTHQPKVQKGESVKNEVLDVLKQGYTDNNHYHLPNIRLERKLYVEVNEVLERIGGKWNRKAKAHVFEDVDPKQLLDLVFESGEMPPKNPTAFFPTPDSVVDYILTDGAFYRIPGDAKRILEPSAGKGNIAEGIREYCRLHHIDATIDCCEILPRFQDQLKSKGFNVIDEPDFLAYHPTHQYDAIIANPPFAIEGDPLAYITHIEHAYSLLAPGGTLSAVVPSGFIFRDDKRVKKLRELVEAHGTWRELKQGAFTDSGTGVNTAIISMRKALR